jgi:hypothetical protein
MDDKEFLIDCLGDILLSCNDRCIGNCNCQDIYDKAVEIVERRW